MERSTSPRGDELVSAIAQLTDEVQRFDLMLCNSRDVIEHHGASTGQLDDELISNELERIRARIGYVATRARGALEEFATSVLRL